MFEVQIEPNAALLLKVTLISSSSISTTSPSFMVPVQTQKSVSFSLISVKLPDGEVLMLHISPGWCNSTVFEPRVYFRYCTTVKDATK